MGDTQKVETVTQKLDNNISWFQDMATDLGTDPILIGFATLGGAIGFLTGLYFFTKPYIFNVYIWTKDKYNSSYYRYIGFRKHVTVFKDGHGIIIQDIELRIYKTNKPFIRVLDISDSPDQCVFPALNNMQKTRVEERFKKYGFWYSSSPANIIIGVTHLKDRSNKKKMTFKFSFDPDIVKTLKGKPVKLLYGFSIPDLYPMKDGKYDDSQKVPNILTSDFAPIYPLNYFNYVIGLEDGVKLTNITGTFYPKGEEGKGIDIAVIKKDDLFYSKYAINVKNPKVGSLIRAQFTVT